MDLLMKFSSIDHLNRKSNYGFTPLDLAIEYGDPATADYLRKLGAKTS